MSSAQRDYIVVTKPIVRRPALKLALAAGAGVDEAAWIANLAAGVEVGKQGTATVSPSEVREAWERFVGA